MIFFSSSGSTSIPKDRPRMCHIRNVPSSAANYVVCKTAKSSQPRSHKCPSASDRGSPCVALLCHPSIRQNSGGGFLHSTTELSNPMTEKEDRGEGWIIDRLTVPTFLSDMDRKWWAPAFALTGPDSCSACGLCVLQGNLLVYLPLGRHQGKREETERGDRPDSRTNPFFRPLQVAGDTFGACDPSIERGPIPSTHCAPSTTTLQCTLFLDGDLTLFDARRHCVPVFLF